MKKKRKQKRNRKWSKTQKIMLLTLIIDLIFKIIDHLFN